MRYAIAVDLGGTKIAAARIDSGGNIQQRIKQPIDKRNTAAQISDAVNQLADPAVSAVGIIVPGIYYPATGNVWAPNLFGWDDVPLRDQLRLPAPVAIDSDRAGYVLGEQWRGAARGCSNVVFLAVGTGIGAGILIDGKLCRGAGDIAGAAGWFGLTPEHKEIYLQTGCWEAEAAGPAVARRFGAGNAEAVAEAARRGDPRARGVLEETARWLAMGIANIVSLLNPEMVVLGGGLMQAGDLLLEPIRRELPRWCQPRAAQQVRIEMTQLGEDAGLYGAARLAFLAATS